MRAYFNPNSRALLFTRIDAAILVSQASLAKKAGVHKRTLNGWKNGVSGIPLSFLSLVEEEFSVQIPRPEEIVSDSEIRSRNGILGGKARQALYGDLGTLESRTRGGISSYKSHIKKDISPFHRKTFSRPKLSKDLAEFAGILLGDGGVTERQITISSHRTDEAEYAMFVANLIQKLFAVNPVIAEMPKRGVLTVTVSRTGVVDFLKDIGLGANNKVREQAGVPEWIRKRLDFKIRCIRGLFDTDGCIYTDTHIIKGKMYRSRGMAFSNRSLPLLSFFKKTLRETGFSPTQSTKYIVFLRKNEDVVRYLRVVGSSNPKHIRRFRAHNN